jgi:hypothetical protein
MARAERRRSSIGALRQSAWIASMSSRSISVDATAPWWIVQ